MKAAVIHEFGDADVLRYEDVATPEPKPGHVLIKVLAAGVNRLDHYLRAGTVVPDLAFPHILGADAVGEVAALGQGVTGIEIGQRVIAAPGWPLDAADYEIEPAGAAPSFTLPGLGVWGSYAQYMEAPARYVVTDDTGLAPEAVATLPVALATAVRSVKKVGRVGPGDSVLIQAGGSGSGSMQIQIAKALGARVATTVRDDAKGALAADLGADLVIDTRDGDPVERVKAWTEGRGADVVIDNLGGAVLAQSINAVKPFGTVVAFGFAAGAEVRFDIRDLFFGQKQIKGSMASDIDDLEWGLAQLRAGRVRPVLDRALPLSRAAEAHRLIATNQVKGNIVLLPWAA